jgi:hypothetical protein
MANDDPLPPPEPFTMLLPVRAIATDVEAHRVALEEQRKKELVERQKFRVEPDLATAMSLHNQ